MVYHYLVAALGVAGLFGLWLGVQMLVRRSSKETGSDPDVLACRTCGTPGACGGCAHETAAAERDRGDRGFGGPVDHRS
jgi:hypothetical protein